MITIIGTLVLGGLGFAAGYFSGVVSAEFAALVAILIWWALRFRRAMGIGEHIEELRDEQCDRFDDWRNLGKLKGTSDERNRIAREIDYANEDIDRLNLIKW